MGSRILAALPSAGSTAIQLFSIGGMSITYQSLTLTMRAGNSDGDHERLLFFENGLTFTVYHILLIWATILGFTQIPSSTEKKDVILDVRRSGARAVTQYKRALIESGMLDEVLLEQYTSPQLF